MGDSFLRSVSFILVLLLILAGLNPAISAALSVGGGCNAKKAIKVKWNNPKDYSTFQLQVENTCRCDARNVVLHLRMLVPGRWNQVVERVSVKNGKILRAGEKMAFIHHVNFGAEIATAQPSADFINCI